MSAEDGLESLTPEQLKSRLRLDYQVAMKMRYPLMSVTAYRNPEDLEKRRNPIVSEEAGHLATFYLADYFIKTLTGPDRYATKTSVKLDLLAHGNYPYTPPEEDDEHNSDAALYWRTRLGGQALNPDLPYPVLPRSLSEEQTCDAHHPC